MTQRQQHRSAEEEIERIRSRIEVIANTTDALERDSETAREYDDLIERIQSAGYNIEVLTDNFDEGPFNVVISRNEPDYRQGDWIHNAQQPLLPNGLKSPPRRQRDSSPATPRTHRLDTPRFADFGRYRRTPFASREPTPRRSGRTAYAGYTDRQNPQYLQYKDGYSSLASTKKSAQATSDYNTWTRNLSTNDPTDQKILAIQKLVGELHSDMRRSDELLSYPRAQKFVTDRNASFKARGQPEPYSILPWQDYDGDEVPDTIIGRNNKIYSYNGYRPKESDHPLRQAFFVEHPEGPYKRKAITGITYDEEDMHTPVSWNSDEYSGYLLAVKPKIYKNVDRILANRAANDGKGRHRSVFQILVMLVSKEIQNIKAYFKENVPSIEISNASDKTGVGTITAIASAINQWLFLEPAFERYNEQKPSNARPVNMERWESKNKDLRPLPFERTAIKKTIQDLFTTYTSAERMDGFKRDVSNITIEQFKLRNPETAEIIDVQQQSEI
jgi:hypothetical protein